MITLKIIQAILETFGMFAVGAIIMRFKMLEENDIAKLSRIIVDIFFPMLIFDSITKNFRPEQLNELWLMPVIGFAFMLFGGGAGFLLQYGLKNRSQSNLVTFRHLCAINNYLFLPLIVISNLWGDQFIPLLLIMNIGSTIGLWTIGVGLLAGGDWKRTVNNIFGINQLAVALALAFCFCHFPVPYIVSNIFGKLGNCSVPLIMMLIGASIYCSSHVFKDKWDMFYMVLVRLVIIPLCIIFILKQLPLPDAVYKVSFIVAVMPVSASSSVFTRIFGGSHEFSSQAIIFTTIASGITIPLLLMLL